MPLYKAQAQSHVTSETTTITFNPSDLHQWERDLRRLNIITFGLFPFSMFAVTFTTEMIRWYNANGCDFSEQGRQHAPWPFKSAGGIGMTNDEHVRTILLAAGLSVTIALVDLIIVNAKRNNERRRIESLPAGSYDIERIPYGPAEDEDAVE